MNTFTGNGNDWIHCCSGTAVFYLMHVFPPVEEHNDASIEEKIV
jgi:hypothetical protein